MYKSKEQCGSINSLLVVFCIVVFSNCTSFKVSTSPKLSAAPEMAVKGKGGLTINRKLSFGDFKTVKIDRSLIEGIDVSGGKLRNVWMSYSARKQSVHFSLQDSLNNLSEVFCISKFNADDYTLGDDPNDVVNVITDIFGMGVTADNSYMVEIYLKKEAAPWQMLIDMKEIQKSSRNYTGIIAKNKDQYYTLKPITTIEKNGKQGRLPFGSVGFEIKNKDGIAVAAVSLLEKGSVFIGTNEPYERFLIANVCAALLLYNNIG